MAKHKWHKEIKNILRYDNGKLYWTKQVSNRIKIGDEAGSIDTHGYIQIKIDKKPRLAHQIVWLMFNNELPEQIDHINRNRQDNRIENLRASNNSLNQQNTSYLGITFKKDTNKWSARIQANGKRHELGNFINKQDAINAYQIAKGIYHGKTA